MKQTNIRFESDKGATAGFRRGVSLHSHTLHSRESLNFIYKFAAQNGLIGMALRRGEAKYRAAHGAKLDLNRAWWTPPSAPHDAWLLEKRHIEDQHGLEALVSITDHDDIDAPLSLRILDECRDLPVSLEWTVPFGETFFHLGIHNLDPGTARTTMNQLAQFTSEPALADLAGILESLAAKPAALIVFNHPCWDEPGIGVDRHRAHALAFIHGYAGFLHAFELNGLRPWPENRAVFELARQFGKPVISGGDRHALEPNTVLNLTNAATFAEFVDAVRGGHSEVLITRQYQEPFALRILQSVEEILQNHETHGRGWRRWTDRVFYLCDDGVIRQLSQMFPDRLPGAVQVFVGGVKAIRRHTMRHAFRLAFGRRQEYAL